MRIGMTAAQNDERADQGLVRTVDKQKLKHGSCATFKHRILNGVRGTVRFRQLGWPRASTDSQQNKEKTQVLYKIGVTVSPHPVLTMRQTRNANTLRKWLKERRNSAACMIRVPRYKSYHEVGAWCRTASSLIEPITFINNKEPCTVMCIASKLSSSIDGVSHMCVRRLRNK